jgi:hypothetical protein
MTTMSSGTRLTRRRRLIMVSIYTDGERYLTMAKGKLIKIVTQLTIYVFPVKSVVKTVLNYSHN